MPISVLVMKINKFEYSPIIIDAQTQLIGDDLLGLYEGEGTLTFEDARRTVDIGDDKIKVFRGHYDLKKVQSGIVFEKEFSYYFEPHSFNVYLDPVNDLIIVAVKKAAAFNFINELQKQRVNRIQKYSFKKLNIDFDKITANANNVSGLWAQIKRGHVHSKGYFGNGVNEDAEVKQVIAEKRTSYVQIETQMSDNSSISLGITKDGNIVLQTPPKSEKELLVNVLSVYNNFLI